MIYNYLISDYVNRENTRSNSFAHKKSELKKIYGDIVKISKDTPSYLIHPSIEAQSFALQLKESSLGLQNTLIALKSDGLSSAFSYKEARSDNEDAVTATITTDDYSTLPEPFSLQINKLATPQINTGNYIPRTRSLLPEGNYQFQIQTEDHSYQFNINFKKKPTNETAIRHIAQTINNSSAPISAQTELNSSKKEIRLILQSECTGTPDGSPIFTCEDLLSPNKSSGCVAFSGINHTTQLPENSSFQINGQQKSTMANEFTLNNSLHVTFKEETTKPVQISFESDTAKILDEVNNLTTTYNQLVDFSYSKEEPPRLASLMLHDLKSIFSSAQSELKNCGVTFNTKGYMEISNELATEAARKGQFESIFRENKQLSTTAYKQSQTFSLNPMKYIQNKIIVTYPNPAKEHFANPYMTSIYSGMLFNSYC